MPKKVITCLIGDPVEQSVSDVMYEYFATVTGIENYNHLKFRVLQDNPKNLEIAVRSLAALGMTGANVTIPYKVSVMKYLDAIDGAARLVGAVNTIVNKNGKLIGYNTDGQGAIRALETKLRPIQKTDNIVVIGAGGAARAVVGSLPKVQRVTLLSMPASMARARKMKRDFRRSGVEIDIESLTDQHIISELRRADFVINATPVGMYPKGGVSLITKTHLTAIGKPILKEKMFFDVIFNPFETEFLRLAEAFGAKTCPGIYMTIHQGIRAFELWTGKKFPESATEKTAKLLMSAMRKF